MSVISTPKPTPAVSGIKQEFRRGLTLRSFIVCIFAILLMSMWIDYEELYNFYGGWFCVNNPANCAICTLIVLATIFAILYRFRRTLRLVTAEFIFICSALIIATPIVAYGFWWILFGYLVQFPYKGDQASFIHYEYQPEWFWPHGNNLVGNNRFLHGLDGFTKVGSGDIRWENVEWKGKSWKTPIISNPSNSTSKTSLDFTFNRTDAAGKEVLVPGESFLISTMVKASDLTNSSVYYISEQIDDKPVTTLVSRTDNTPLTYDNPGGLQRIGFSTAPLPIDFKQKIHFSIGLSGPGTLAIQDLQFMNTRAMQAGYSGRRMVLASHLHKLGGDERDNLTVKPDNMWSLAGVKYLIGGLIPWDQWALPFLAWLIFVVLTYIGFLGFNVLMRKHWVDNERIALPVNNFYRYFFGEEAGEDGVETKPIWRNKIVWIGFAVLLPIALSKGLKYYFPALPGLTDNPIPLDPYVTDPMLKIFLQKVRIYPLLCLFSIALLVEKDLLFSIWTCFFLFQFQYVFGKVFNFARFSGYPWTDQQIAGSFLAYAMLALIAARKHLKNLFLHLIKRVRLDDSQEVVPYRLAFALITISLVGLTVWGVCANMSWLSCLAFFGYMLIIGLAASKIRAEVSMMYHSWIPNMPIVFLSLLGGIAVFGSNGVFMATIIGSIVFGSIFMFIAPAQIEMMEIGRHFKVKPRDIGGGLTLGVIGGFIIGGFVILTMIYGFGASNVATNWWFGGNINNVQQMFDPGQTTLNTAVAANPHGHIPIPIQNRPFDIIHNLDAIGIAIGFVITIFLSLMRSFFIWFPFHPLGYIIATTSNEKYIMDVWFPVFAAWVVRFLVSKFGGAYSVRRGLVPFAVGMFMACIASVIIFDIVGIYLRMHGATQVFCRWP